MLSTYNKMQSCDCPKQKRCCTLPPYNCQEIRQKLKMERKMGLSSNPPQKRNYCRKLCLEEKDCKDEYISSPDCDCYEKHISSN